MARPKCGFCQGLRFEVSTIDPASANFKMLATICASCGAVLGVTEFFNIGALLKKLAQKLNVSLD